MSRQNNILLITLISFTYLLAAAHFFRACIVMLSIICLLMPFLFFIRQRWSLRLLQIGNVLISIVWIVTTGQMIRFRIEGNMNWIRLAIIMLIVILLNLTAVRGLFRQRLKLGFLPENEESRS